MTKRSRNPVQCFCDILESIIVVNLHLQSKGWKDILWKCYVYFIHVLFVLHFSLHLLSTLTRSVHHMPEFFQKLAEDCVVCYCMIGVHMVYQHYPDIKSIAYFIEHSLSNADEKVIAKCNKTAFIIIGVFMTGACCDLLFLFIETNLPLSEQEIETLKCIYGTKHPERRLLFSVWIPFIDETEMPHYVLIYALQIITIVLILLPMCALGALLPMIIVIIKGQYTILSAFVEKVGELHTDSLGNTIYYTNIERNKYIVKPVTEPSPSSSSSVNSAIERAKFEQRERQERQRQLLYERLYFRQLVRFHQKLSILQSMIVGLYNNGMLLRILTCSLALYLCLYQLTLSAKTLSYITLVKFASEAVTTFAEYYFICFWSETLDDCHVILRRAVIKSGWYRCSNRSKQDLCCLLRWIQRPNHLKFNQGFTIVLTNLFFVKALKVSYSFVNFLRLKSQ